MLSTYRARCTSVAAISVFTGVVVVTAVCSAPRSQAAREPVEPAAIETRSTVPPAAEQRSGPLQTGAPGPSSARSGSLTREDSAQFAAAGKLAWQHFNRLWRTRTGLANATPDYAKLTTWDMGSVLAALHSGRMLGYLDEVEYRKRVAQALKTINALPLYRGVAYNRMYEAGNGAMIGRGGAVSKKGYGWSATDLGRLLLWLRITADAEPAVAAQAERAARRIRVDSVVQGGYLHGEDVGSSGRARRFQEGRIGYEQYSATGFSMWGVDVAAALDLHRNARPVTVAGATLLEDVRGLDRIVSEPFVLMGLEVGWTPAYRELALSVLSAQEQYADSVGRVVIAGEDAVSVKPYYFYYYCIYCTKRPFVIEVSEPGKTVANPRWVSTKSSFGWHALVGSDYTRRAVQTVAPAARPPRGWSSGVFEGTSTPTYTFDINTAAVVLEAVAYASFGRPLASWRRKDSLAINRE